MSLKQLQLDRYRRLIEEWELLLRQKYKYEDKWQDVRDAYYELRREWLVIDIAEEDELVDYE